jgi:hypothetical protein
MIATVWHRIISYILDNCYILTGEEEMDFISWQDVVYVEVYKWIALALPISSDFWLR